MGPQDGCDLVNVMVRSELDCLEYTGEYPKLQETDMHISCPVGESAAFNWRIVYPRIKMPTQSANLQLTLADCNHEDFGNTRLGELNLVLHEICQEAAEDGQPIVAFD